ncbi:MAG: RluA family pseudouridine synthase [Candidatus Nanopelagicales bacterium]
MSEHTVPEETVMEEHVVESDLAGERLDVALSRLLGISRTQAANVIGDQRVLVDGKVGKRSEVLKREAVVQVLVELEAADEDAELEAVPELELPILFQDEDIVVVDKPVGMAAHASPGWRGPTVTGALSLAGIRVAGIGAAEREGIVHRLDVGTSGLMVVAKSDRAYSSLKEQFRSREVEKKYHALVQGHPEPSAGTIDAPIGRHPDHDYRFAVVNDGKASITHYETLEAFAYASLLDIHLETGRTHQIRVHMSATKHPCCGDLTYGADPVLAKRLRLERQWLHAVELGFRHPGTDEWVSFSSDYPADLVQSLETLREGL